MLEEEPWPGNGASEFTVVLVPLSTSLLTASAYLGRGDGVWQKSV